jgi:hypothetical protein
VAADVVQRADVRMIQRRDGLRFTLEALAQLDSIRDVGREMATVRPRRVSRAR